MKKLVNILTLLLLASCTKQEAMLSSDELARADSMALHVALTPSLSSLPAYYAEQTGLWDSVGVDVRLMRYEAQLDVDTALINHHAEMALSDLIRALRLFGEQTPVWALMSVDEPIAMVAVKGRRVKKINQLKERMIAISRLSVTDYWCDRFLEFSTEPQTDFYRPQVHSIKLRADMLRTGLMDAAMLPEPYTSWMLATDNVLIHQTGKDDIRLMAWVATKESMADTVRFQQIERFTQAYRMAAEQIESGEGNDIVRDILHREYGLPREMADTLEIPSLSIGETPARKDIDKAIEWLQSRKRLPRGMNADSLLLTGS